MKKILAIDPGMSTGLAHAVMHDDEPLEFLEVHQIEGGLSVDLMAEINLRVNVVDFVVVEKFLPRQMARSYRLEELEPLRIEGFIQCAVDGFVVVDWREPSQRKLVDGDIPASEAILRKMGYAKTGRDVGCRDADDANSAIMHALSFARHLRHVPTMRAILDATN